MSRPSSPRPRSPRRRAAIVAVGALAFLGACSHQRSVPTSYGDTTHDNFIEGCVETLTADSDDLPTTTYSDDEANSICTCSYEAIEEDVPFDEFKQINEEQEEDPTELPAVIADPIKACEDSESSPS